MYVYVLYMYAGHLCCLILQQKFVRLCGDSVYIMTLAKQALIFWMYTCG